MWRSTLHIKEHYKNNHSNIQHALSGLKLTVHVYLSVHKQTKRCKNVSVILDDMIR